MGSRDLIRGGRAIKELREQWDLAQKQLIGVLASTERSICDIERGRKPARRQQLVLTLTKRFHLNEVEAISQILIWEGYVGLSREEIQQHGLHVSVPKTESPIPQFVRWGPADGKPAGICIDSCLSGLFVPWTRLRPEIEERLLNQVREVPIGSTTALGEFRGRRDWIVRIMDSSGREIGNVWFGPDPDNNWASDGLVRVGEAHKPTEGSRIVWQIYQRYSDASYRRIKAFDRARHAKKAA